MEDKIAIYGKNLDISDRINDYVVQKVSKVERFLLMKFALTSPI